MQVKLIRTYQGKSIYQVSKNPSGFFESAVGNLAFTTDGSKYQCLGGSLWKPLDEIELKDEVLLDAIAAAAQSGGGGGGGGGAAYPDNQLIIEEAGEMTLTTDDQGFISTAAANVVFNLPSVAGTGTIFKFNATIHGFTVNAGSKIITTLLSNTMKLSPNMRVDLIAINIDLGGGLDLYWVAVQTQTLNISAWDEEVRYFVGMMVSDGLYNYISLSNDNLNEEPASNPNKWFRVPSEHIYNASSVSVDGDDISFTADTPPTDYGGGTLNAKRSVGVRSFEFNGSFGTPGVDVTQIVIALGDAIDADADVANIIPNSNVAGIAMVGAYDIPCRYISSSRSIVITIPSYLTGVTAQSIHAQFSY